MLPSRRSISLCKSAHGFRALNGEVKLSALIIYFIRHAEKPNEQWPGPGLNAEGTQDAKSLVIRGWQRAGAWAALFGEGLGQCDYLAPQAVFAAKPGDGPSNEGASRRPDETVLPLVERLGLNKDQFNTGIKQDQAMRLVGAIQKLSGVVLVCWEHKALVNDILPLMPLEGSSPPIPTKWNDDRYDVVLRFDRAMGSTKFAFRELYPRLLSGDSDKPLGTEEGERDSVRSK